ncbi:unnamed protein product [Angiostrongylus costaricensis]|uniref:Methyltransferase-like protein 13 n=1 Tax=Angiostrongylus costaricensis TaxID=334426 RepID=A0A0R3PWZ3_ANGCS|nr:unnamed protein product [Angiostrongylus costaricensis]
MTSIAELSLCHSLLHTYLDTSTAGPHWLCWHQHNSHFSGILLLWFSRVPRRRFAATTMRLEMFASGAVEIRRDAVAKVLCVGLGGGYLNSHLHHRFPKLDPMMLRIARKWFDLDEDYRHRVIIDDGLNYMKSAAESGIQYDVVHLDVCTTDPNAKSLCPLDVFFSEEALNVLLKLISKQGSDKSRS